MSAASPEQPLVVVVVLNCNGMGVIRECLATLKQSTYPRVRICVSDNASTDGSPDWVETHHPDVHVIRNARNLGWSGANNVGIRYALQQGARWVWILNNDVEVAADCIEKLVAHASDHEGTGILSPLIHYFDPANEVWFEGGRIDFKGMVADHCDRATFESLPQDERFISGCALLVHSDVFARIGPIDERFFIYFEDVDFCLRAARAGVAMDVVRTARMVHKVSTFSGGVRQRSPWKAYYTLRSGLLFWRKHLGWWAFHRRYCRGHLAKWLNHLPEEVADEQGRAYADAVIDALWYFVSGKKSPLERPRSAEWFRSFVLRRPWLVAELMAFRFLAVAGSAARKRLATA